MFKRVVETKIIDVFDAKGRYVGKLAITEFENLFNWYVFLAIFLPGLLALGRI